jgi:Flp pilus assembly protein protease CpaA
MSYYFSVWNGAQIVGAAGSLVINAVLLLAILTCAYTDTKTGKILNKITFPAMLAGIILNTAFGVMSGAGLNGLWWSLIGLCVGMAIQWVPYLLSFAKAGDVKLLMAVGALKGWAFCSFGFCLARQLLVFFSFLGSPSAANCAASHPTSKIISRLQQSPRACRMRPHRRQRAAMFRGAWGLSSVF